MANGQSGRAEGKGDFWNSAEDNAILQQREEQSHQRLPVFRNAWTARIGRMLRNDLPIAIVGKPDVGELLTRNTRNLNSFIQLAQDQYGTTIRKRLNTLTFTVGEDFYLYKKSLRNGRETRVIDKNPKIVLPPKEKRNIMSMNLGNSAQLIINDVSYILRPKVEEYITKGPTW